MKKIRILILFSFFLLCSIYAQQKDTISLRIMTYNIRFGELASMEQIAQHIKAFSPDLVALQELDSKTFREITPQQNGKDFITELGYFTQMFPLYGKSINYKDGYYGIGILSKFPYVKVEKVMLPRPQQKEQRVMLQAVIELSETDTICFACTHLDYSSEDTRIMQIKKITDVLEESSYPIILGGDFNALPTSKTIQTGMKNWKLLTDDDLTFPAHQPSIKIDYLFGYPTNEWRLIKSQTIQSQLSDHLPIITQVELIRDKK